MLREPLHGVTVSVGYSDYLDVALGHNRPHLDHCVVATEESDADTQRVARRHACELLITDAGRAAGSDRPAFNKGAMVEAALQQLPQYGWRCHFDADILFPGNFLARLGPALYDKKALYGADRFNVVGPEAYRRLVEAGYATRGWEYQHYLLYPWHGAELGGRLVYHDQGVQVLGYWQCWHAEAEFGPDGVRVRTYPTGSNGAAHDDVQFSMRWPRSRRILVPEVLLAHLVTDDVRYGINWGGRKTRPFVPGRGAAGDGGDVRAPGEPRRGGY